MEASHVYEEEPPPLPKCFFKYRSNRLKELSEAVINFTEAIERFGVFEVDNPPAARRIASSLDDFEKKVSILKVGRRFAESNQKKLLSRELLGEVQDGERGVRRGTELP